MTMTRTWPSIDEIAASITAELKTNDLDSALRVLLDGVNRLETAYANDDLEATLAAPRSTGSTHWDTLLAASVRYRLHRLGVKPPRWTWKDPLPKFWWPVSINASKQYNDMAHTPAELVRVGIFMNERGFESA